MYLQDDGNGTIKKIRSDNVIQSNNNLIFPGFYTFLQ